MFQIINNISVPRCVFNTSKISPSLSKLHNWEASIFVLAIHLANPCPLTMLVVDIKKLSLGLSLYKISFIIPND
jgi:hypothetical protein